MISHILNKVTGGFWTLKNRARKEKGLYLKIYQYIQSENNSSIGYDSNFEGAPCFPHGIKGIFISSHAKIGGDCVIFQQVTIGSNTLIDSKSIGAPIIGNNCYIGSGAKIIGNIRIGNNVRIGANSTVYKDIPSNSVVTGDCKVTHKNNIDNTYYSFSKNQWMYFSNGSYHIEKNKDKLKVLNRII